MLRQKIVIIGTSGHALVITDIIERQGQFEIAAYLDNINTDKHGTLLGTAPIVGGLDRISDLQEQGVKVAFVAIGDCRARFKIACQLKESGFELATLVHPGAIVARDAILAEGTVVMAGAVINPAAIIADNCIINTCSSVDHECSIGSGSHISPGAHLAGRVRVGEQTWIGIGTVVKEKISIGSHSIVGAGSVVIKDIPDKVIAFGAPCRVMRANDKQK